MKIILASASPRRRELLKQIGWEFTIQVSKVEEKITRVLAHEVVEELSAQKAEDVAEQIRAGAECTEELLVIGADTVVACEGQILGKPRDREDMMRMLSMLQGRDHFVYTGVTVIWMKQKEVICRKTFHEATKVQFYPMRQEEIASYADSLEPEGKAGSYAIQGLGARYIKGIEGDYNNVVGLPVGRLYQEVCAMKGEC